MIIGVDGASDFYALHSGKHNEKVQLCAFDVLALDVDDYLDAPTCLRPLPDRSRGPDQVSRERRARALAEAVDLFRYGQADAEKRSRACLEPNLGWRRACDSAIMPGCMATKGGHRMPHNFARQCIQIVGFRLEEAWQTLQ